MATHPQPLHIDCGLHTCMKIERFLCLSSGEQGVIQSAANTALREKKKMMLQPATCCGWRYIHTSWAQQALRYCTNLVRPFHICSQQRPSAGCYGSLTRSTLHTLSYLGRSLVAHYHHVHHVHVIPFVTAGEDQIQVANSNRTENIPKLRSQHPE